MPERRITEPPAWLQSPFNWPRAFLPPVYAALNLFMSCWSLQCVWLCWHNVSSFLSLFEAARSRWSCEGDGFVIRGGGERGGIRSHRPEQTNRKWVRPSVCPCVLPSTSSASLRCIVLFVECPTKLFYSNWNVKSWDESNHMSYGLKYCNNKCVISVAVFLTRLSCIEYSSSLCGKSNEVFPRLFLAPTSWIKYWVFTIRDMNRERSRLLGLSLMVNTE